MSKAEMLSMAWLALRDTGKFMNLHQLSIVLPTTLLASCALVACAHKPLQPATPRTLTAREIGVVERARQFGLIPVQEAVPGIWVDQRYTTPRNITGSPFYPPALPCLIHRDTAAKLAWAQNLLADSGYQLKIWDAYRPPESHLFLFKKFGQSGYVHEPGFEGRWSYHCYGRAVDVTLLDSNGQELPMPSGFDDFSDHAWAAYLNGDPEITARLRTLQSAMMRAGFSMLDREWWHFSDVPSGPLGAPVMAADLGL